MPAVMNMPEVMANATEATLYAWLKNEGDTVSVGEAIAEVETEKATVEVEADADGVVARLLVVAGANVDVGTPIAVIKTKGETDDDVAPVLASLGTVQEFIAEPAETSRGADVAINVPVHLTKSTIGVPKSHQPGSLAGRVFSSPLARRIARENGLTIDTITGTGPHGRILRRDVETAVAEDQTGVAAIPIVAETTPQSSSSIPAGTASPPNLAPGHFEDVPHTRMRQAIARRLTESTTTVPHFYLRAAVRVDALLGLRKQINETSPRKITVNDLVVKAVGLALQDVPAANVIWTDEAERRFSTSDVSVAIAIAGGLLTPVVRGIESISLTNVSCAIADYVERAKAGKIRQEELTGGSFSVTNLGMFGTKEFTAILNPPQSGILAVGAAEQRSVAIDGAISVATMMTCTLSADHRVIDGAVAAEWMRAFAGRIENPISILI